MDPNDAYVTMMATASKKVRADAALDLLVWLAHGGFSPLGNDRAEVIDRCERALRNEEDG